MAALYAARGRGVRAAGLRLLRPLWPFVVVVGGSGTSGPAMPGAGLAIVLRLMTAVALANLVTMTTRLSDMIAVLERLARPLARLGLSPRLLALAIALVIRFIPVMLRPAGADHARPGAPARPRRPRWRVLVPATLAALDDADHVAEALRARGGAG